MRHYLFPALRALALLLALTVASSRAVADIVVRDHITEPSLWNTTWNVYNHSESSLVPSLDGWAASSFVGNGHQTARFEGLFVTEKGGVPNAGNFGVKDFKILFYEDENAFAAPNWRSGTMSVLMDAPSNAGWETPIGVAEGWDVYHLAFDVSFPTVMGQTHYFSIVPVGPSSVGGVSLLRFSTGGPGAIGLELDLFRDANGLGPGTLQSLGAPYNYVATSATLSTVPAPGAAVSLLLLSAVGVRRRR